MSPPATHLSWSHFIEILPLKTQEAKLFYLNEAARGHISKYELRELIQRKAFERKEIANAKITNDARVPFNTFKDPYLFDIFGLKDDYLEADLEAAILRELEKFILEFGSFGRIPVQVKGTQNKNIVNGQLSVRVSVADLVNYKRDGGCIYFVVLIF